MAVKLAYRSEVMLQWLSASCVLESCGSKLGHGQLVAGVFLLLGVVSGGVVSIGTILDVERKTMLSLAVGALVMSTMHTWYRMRSLLLLQPHISR